MVMQNTPCGWTPNFTGCTSGPCCPDIDAQTPAAIAAKALATTLATQLMWMLTGRRFGCCEITVRPCQLGSCCDTTLADIIFQDVRNIAGNGNLGVLSFTPTLIGGDVFNVKCGLCNNTCCTCCPPCHVNLPGPVCEIEEVVVNGRPLGKSQYQVFNHNELAFTEVGQTVVLDIPGAPLPAGITQATAFTLTSAFGGAQLTDIGSTYDFELAVGHQDVQWVVEIPVGNISTVINVFQPQNFDVIVLDGGSPTVEMVTASQVKVGPATVPDTRVKLLFRAPKAATNVKSIVMRQDAPGPGAIVLTEVSWTDPSTGTGGCPTNREIKHLNVPGPEVCCKFPTSSYTDVGNGGLHCFDQPAAGICNIPAGTWKVRAGGNTSPDPGTMLVAFSDGQKLFEQAGPFNCGDFGEVAPPIVNSGVFTFAGPVTATLFFEQDNGAGIPKPITDPFICYSAPDTVETSGANCQNYSKANGEVGTWSVKYTLGEPVTPELDWAAGMLACELAKAMLNDKSCGLPQRVQNVARQGIDVAFFDPTAFANAGLTGLPLVDMVIRAVNPYHMAEASYVWSPDLAKQFRRETS